MVIQDQNLSEIEVFAKKQHEEDEAFRKKIHASHIPIQQKLDAIKQHREQQKQEHDAFLKKMRLERMPHHGMPNANAADNNR